ncbi:MAG: hypothetical protein FRX48_00985 [Lasallia pustulata]|uniref:GDS1 winged helix domain-containing protein n=1 Tax=Lasallia pustulata TaxID=136370 RepID=A0A5M8Q4Y3_9LECA|nr:MAG: hypothetical protein FRX48_00985 [Lasallia pustulata]
MPYNTRRKSLSLPSLGIQLPNTSRSHRPSPPKSSATEIDQPAAKRVKRSHTSDSPPPPPPSESKLSTRPSRTSSTSSKNVTFAERPKSSGRTAYEHTPPPSPGATDGAKIDTEGINDDIVTGVIQQLEKTGNRPHLIKELAAVLSTTNDAVASSANPAALLSSRLSTYLRRPGWSALAPCPLGKELIPIHPRKVYFYLTNSPRQDFPADSSDILASPLINTVGAGGKGGRRIISPSISSASVDEDLEGAEDRKRAALSPSPEVDLSSHELDAATDGVDDDFANPPTPAGSFSGRSSLARDGTSGSASENIRLVHNHRAASPPLEGDEREFTQTASSMRMRGMSPDDANIRQSTEVENAATEEVVADEMILEESEEEKAKRNREAAAALFGGHHEHGQEVGLGLMSSPLYKHMLPLIGNETKKEEAADVEMAESTSILGEGGFSWDVREPATIGLDELDDLLGGF